ncbi:MAG: response regulator transcription factor [Rhodospirillales bacterium]|nr:response regulator transcription factor [Rhodospirillales bacterium]
MHHDSLILGGDASPVGRTPPEWTAADSSAAFGPIAADPCREALRVAFIDDRVLASECFARSIQAAYADISVSCFSSVAEWMATADHDGAPSIILLYYNARRAEACERDIELLARHADGTPVVLMSDEEADAEAIIRAIELGARGFIPASVNLVIAVVAMRLVQVGGLYVPESILKSSRRLLYESANSGKREIHDVFTERQAAVVLALRQGKPNKIIAHELSMRESTVKVHIRNIMKKLKATNRTEVAFMTNTLFKDTGC